MSGVDVNGNEYRKGAGDAIIQFVESKGGRPPAELQEQLDLIGREGGTPLAVCRDNHVLGVVYLKDIVKEGMQARFDELRRMGISTVMVTGDNRLTAAKIAEESGVDDFLPEATPEQKLELIRTHQGEGRMVAMAGDGTNDAPALAQSDVGVAMNTGTQAAREAGNMVDLDSNPTKLIEIVEIGKQLLITRGALTTFSIANDVAKYFAILPAIFAFTYAIASRRKGAARRAQHHEPRHAALGDPLGDRLQRADNPAAGPARPARRPLPSDRRHGAAAAQHADLRPGWPDRALHRNQAARPHHPQPAGSLTCTPPRQRRTTRPQAPPRDEGTTRSSSGWPPASARPTGCCRKATPSRTRGSDVAIGYMEPHKRPETSALAEGLETIPRRRVTYRDTELEEMDLPGVLARAPELALIDELAHTNAAGLEHEKRYEDVKDVLEAGIDVFSTVNVQHLESLNDQVAELTGTRVRETIPDAVLGAADEVVLIDLTPEALISRLRAGKIYPGENIEAALNNFFTVENLLALREVALRQVAQEVEAKRLVVEEPLGTREERVADRGPARGRRAGSGPGPATALLAAARAARLALGAAPQHRPRPSLGEAAGRQGRRRARRRARWRRCASSPRCSGRIS